MSPETIAVPFALVGFVVLWTIFAIEFASPFAFLSGLYLVQSIHVQRNSILYDITNHQLSELHLLIHDMLLVCTIAAFCFIPLDGDWTLLVLFAFTSKMAFQVNFECTSRDNEMPWEMQFLSKTWTMALKGAFAIKESCIGLIQNKYDDCAQVYEILKCVLKWTAEIAKARLGSILLFGLAAFCLHDDLVHINHENHVPFVVDPNHGHFLTIDIVVHTKIVESPHRLVLPSTNPVKKDCHSTPVWDYIKKNRGNKSTIQTQLNVIQATLDSLRDRE